MTCVAGRPLASTRRPPSIPATRGDWRRREARAAASVTVHQVSTSSCRPLASTRNSPSIPTLRVGPLAGRLAPLPDLPPRLRVVGPPEPPPWPHHVDRRRVNRRRRQLLLGPELPPWTGAQRGIHVWKRSLEYPL